MHGEPIILRLGCFWCGSALGEIENRVFRLFQAVAFGVRKHSLPQKGCIQDAIDIRWRALGKKTEPMRAKNSY